MEHRIFVGLAGAYIAKEDGSDKRELTDGEIQSLIVWWTKHVLRDGGNTITISKDGKPVLDIKLLEE